MTDHPLPAAPPESPSREVSIPEVSIIIPARNEESSLGACLQSLTAQIGVAFEIIVVDDGSTDRTREVAQSFAGVRIISPQPLPAAWTGKNNAVIAGARLAHAHWLLFTDADTVHLPGSLARALAEAKKERTDLLSYSPEQVVVTFAERAVMPIVFAELAAQYPPHKVRDQGSGIAAANARLFPLRRRRRLHAHVPQLGSAPRRVDEESGAAVSTPPKAGRPEFGSVARGLGDAWRRCCWRGQSAFCMDRLRPRLESGLPTNSRRAFLDCE